MRRLLVWVLAVLTPFSASGAHADQVVVTQGPAQQPPLQVVSFAAPPAAVTCAEGSVRLVEGAAIPPRTFQPLIPPVMPAGAPSYTPPPPPTSQVFTFSVDAEGRVADLKTPMVEAGAYRWSVDDQAAVIASWRFAPGAGAKGCKIDLTPTYATVAATAPARLFELLVDQQRNTPPAVRKALLGGGDCDRAPYRRPNVVVYPDLRAFDDKSVDPAWAGVRFDIDAGGAVRNVRIIAQHGEAAFADAAAGAMSESKYFPGSARTGCYSSFKALPKATEAAQRPAGESFERPQDQCKVTREALNIPENKFYPPAYGKRRVAGWAILRFDVAPWGQVGAIEVLASQPSAAFGEAARNLLSGARPTPPPSGYRGCVVPILYAIPAIPEDGN